MKRIIIMFIILGLISIGVGIYITNRNKFSENNNPSYDSTRLSADNSTIAENTTPNLSSNENQNSENYNSDAEESTQESKKTETETQI